MATRTIAVPLPVSTTYAWARARLVYLVASFSLVGVATIAGLLSAGIYLPTELLVLTLSVFFGTMMKVADLTVDDGLIWFRGADKVLGVGYGLAGSLLILAHPPLVNFLVPMFLVYFCREKIDRATHGLACTTMLLAVLMADQFIFAVRSFIGTRFFHQSFVSNPQFLTIDMNLNVAAVFLVILLVLGLTEDILEEKLAPQWRGWLYEAAELRYWALPLAYSALSGDWLIFACSALFIKSYELARLSYQGPLRRGWASEPEMARLTFSVYLGISLVVMGWLLTGLAKFSPDHLHSAWNLRQGEYQVYQAERSPHRPNDEVILTVQEGFYGNRAPNFLPTRKFKVVLPSWELRGPSDNVGTSVYDAWRMWRLENPWADPPFQVPPGDWLNVHIWTGGFLGWERHMTAIYYCRDHDDPLGEKSPY